jgi:peroxiredoxin
MSRRILICAAVLWAPLVNNLRAAEAEVKPAASAPAVASPAPAVAVPAGHSLHGEAFDEGPRQKAYLMGGTGDVHFPITTKVPLAQQFFDQGVGQLHGFWYFEAERSFRQVALLDPDCAMAYWGMTMANVNNEKRAKKLIEKAVLKKSLSSVREATWIDALAASYSGSDSTDRRRKYIRDLESLVQDDPNDVEAKAFLALQIWTNGSWMTEKARQLPIGSHQAVDALLEQVFQRAPRHPAHHYRIHLWDEEKAARALISASLCGQAAPSIAHMWHMPGHTYSKLHRYADAAWQQEASARVDHARMMRDGVLPDQIHNYAHNNEWLIRNLAHLGRVREAIDLAKNMIELPRHPKYNMPDRKEGSARFGYTRLADVLAQYELGAEVIKYSSTAYFSSEQSDPDDRLERAQLLGLAWIEQGKLDEARRELTGLEEWIKAERVKRLAAADEAEAKARREKKSKQDVTKAMAEALEPHYARIHAIEPVLGELKGRLALASGDRDQARKEFEAIKDEKSIRRDHLARAFALIGDHAQAEKLARKAVEESPGEVYPLAILVDVLERAGKAQEAGDHFGRLRDLAGAADLDLPVFERLKPIAARLGWPADWRRPQSAADVGVRPDLASLGPFRWQPSLAPNWILTGIDNATLSLEQYRGKPMVLIFYLGSGCLHCVEQLHKFAPLASEFQSAGISLLGISSEPLDSLRASRERLSKGEAIPFALASDPDGAVFKAYRAFDDFENMPLHATFLIDGEGMVRWHDISYEPFSNARFLLDESKRLMSMPKSVD